MIFREFPVVEAVGALLAHGLRLPGHNFRKGRVLSADDVRALRAAGVQRVTAARLDPDEIDEDTAAAEIAALLTGPQVAARPPHAGRCNLQAGAAGVLLVDAARIDALNQIDEAITVATLRPHSALRAGQTVATVKIIPFAVRRGVIDAWRRQAGGEPPLRLAPLRPRSVALIMSRSLGMAEKLLDDTASVTRQRLAGLGSHIDRERRCAHGLEALRDAIIDMHASGSELILIAGASVAKDRGDVVPAALVAAGGRVEHFGMPVEPGNMLLLGRIGDVPVICLPGCARSVRRNGVDWVLRRLLADLPVTGRDIMAMGVGGLIRSPAEEEEKHSAAPWAEARQAPRIAALVLAAGQSRRMGAQNKLLAELEGKPLFCRAVDAALASRCCQVMVVTGWQGDEVAAALGDRAVSRVHNSDFASGMASSLRCGLAALSADVDGVVILLADMPWLDGGHIDRLIAAFDLAAPAILVPEFNGQRGNPVVWPRSYFAEMRQIDGDVGARALLERHAEAVQRVDFDSDAIFVDVDTPAALAQMGSRPQSRAAA